MSPHNDLTRELKHAHHNVRKWWDCLSQHRVAYSPAGKACWIPSVDIQETDDSYHVFVDLAGVDPSSIQLVVDGHTLRLNGERGRPRVESCIRIHQMEIDFGSFERVFQFPVSLDPDTSQSSYRHGLLEIILPKRGKAAMVQVGLCDA